MICEQELVAAVEALQARRILLVSPACKALEELLKLPTQTEVCTAAGEDLQGQLAAAGRCDAAVVSGTLETLSRTEGSALLAALRDVYSATCLAAVAQSGEIWTQGEFIALGFRLRAQCADGALYTFHLASYKSVPDWLNARYWANPQRWGKDRW